MLASSPADPDIEQGIHLPLRFKDVESQHSSRVYLLKLSLHPILRLRN